MSKAVICEVLFLLAMSAGCAGAQRGDETRTESEAITAEHLEKVVGRKVTDAEVREANRQVGVASALWRLVDSKRFVIPGEVVDEQGQRLEGVSVGAGKFMAGTIFNWEGQHQDLPTQTVNGVFTVRASGCKSVTLLIEKGGYYPVKIWFGTAEMSALAEAIKLRKPWQGMETGPYGLRVMLEKRGATTRLKVLAEGGLCHEASGKGTVLMLGEKPWFEEVGNVEKTDALPAECICVLAEKDEHGDIRSVVYHPQYNLSLSEYFPAKIRLLYRGGDGGLVRYHPRNAKKAFHEMRQAPEGGYEKEIVVDLIHAFDKQVLTTDMGRYDKFWFYWKMGGKYGKGIARFQTEKWPIPMVGVRLYVQPDGSRNLEDPLAD